MQIYCDFSGYTDIAIGLALLLGIRFPINFDAPYTARNLQDFWRRWHITLSRWLRDYLYIPLGGSSGSEAKTVRNIMITMVLGGLWHGAAWTFVFWGALHGVGQAVGHVRRRRRVQQGLPPVADGPVRIWVQRFWTFQFVCLGWVFFNASGLSEAFAVLGRMLSGWGEPSPLVTPLLVLIVSGTVASQFVPDDAVGRLQATFSRQRSVVQVGVLVAGPARHHHLRARRRGPLHLLPVLKMPESAPPTETARSDSPDARGARAVAAGAQDLRGGVPALAPPLRARRCSTTRRFPRWAPAAPSRSTCSGPIAATSRALQVSHIVSWTDEATGRTGNQPGNGSLTVLGPVHHHGGHPAKPVRRHGRPSTTDARPGTGHGTGTTVPDITHPTAANPLRVLILGDSLGIDMGGPLQNDLANTGVVQATLDARESTGLTRPDYFNWPAELQSDLGTAQPSGRRDHDGRQRSSGLPRPARRPLHAHRSGTSCTRSVSPPS